MRRYAKMYVSVWDPESEFRDRSPDAQWLFWALVSNPQLSPAGVVTLQPRKWARFAKGMTAKRVSAALEELAAHRYVVVDAVTEEVLIRTFIRYDQGWRTPNIRKSIETSIERVESDALRHAATLELTHAATLEGTLKGTLSRTVNGTHSGTVS